MEYLLKEDDKIDVEEELLDSNGLDIMNIYNYIQK